LLVAGFLVLFVFLLFRAVSSVSVDESNGFATVRHAAKHLGDLAKAVFKRNKSDQFNDRK
jgi:hypothetical protein